MKSHLLFNESPVSADAEDPILMLHRTFQARLAISLSRRETLGIAGSRNLGVVRSLPPPPELSPEMADLISDLNLGDVFDAMAAEDRYLRETARVFLCASLQRPDEILYRQESVRDALRHPNHTRALYARAEEAVEEAAWYRRTQMPGYAEAVPLSLKVQKSVGLLSLLLEKGFRLRDNMEALGSDFTSQGLRDLSEQVVGTLTPLFQTQTEQHLHTLSTLSNGGRLVLSASLGAGLKGRDHVLRHILPPLSDCAASQANPNGRMKGSTRGCAHRTPHRDGILLDNITLSRSACEMEDAALVQLLRLTNRITDSLLQFFTLLRFELAFLVGACNLKDQMVLSGLTFCFPTPMDAGAHGFSFHGLVDLSLALRTGSPPVANDVEAAQASLLLITGANQGGKSTFLRSTGLAQVLLQCGLFVAADTYRAGLFVNVLTHFARAEEPSLQHGRLEEELVRMNRLLQHMKPTSLLLMNESFATTTEREGARIASDLILALYESGVTLLYVTHLHECAAGLFARHLKGALFLRAQQNPKGERSFRVLPGEPLPTSHAMDLYQEVLGKV